MKKRIGGLCIGVMMLSIFIFTIHVLAADYRNGEGIFANGNNYMEESEVSEAKKQTASSRVASKKSNQADLVRICAEITKAKRESDLISFETEETGTQTELATEIMDEAEQGIDRELTVWISKAADFNASEEIVTFLFETMKASGIEQMMPYAMAQIFQESMFDPNAENRNKLDKGILQYRITYWQAVCREHGFPEQTSVFDWKVQISIYVKDMARRLSSGLSIEETISRHKTSDYGTFDAEYVAHVMRWVK